MDSKGDTIIFVSLTCAGIDRNTPLITVNVAVLAEQSNMVGKRILRKREVLERLGIRKTTLHESFIKTGRLSICRPVYPPITDIAQRGWNRRKVPETAVSRRNK
jgi:hypothetical protein